MMKNKKLLIGIVALLLIGGGAGGYFFWYAPQSAEGSEMEEEPPEPAAIVTLAPFLTNIADERRARVEVALAISPISRSEEIQEDTLLLARLRDKILTMLAARNYEELTSPEGKESFRKTIRTAAQEIIGKGEDDGEVQEALFADFVVQ